MIKKEKEEMHECPLRKKIISDGDCFETIMAILGMHSKETQKKLFNEYPKCKEICNNCKYNKEKE